MKNYISLFFVFLFLSCSNGDSVPSYDFDENCIDDNAEFVAENLTNNRELNLFFHANSSIVTEKDESNSTAKIEAGDKIVFEYYYVYADADMIADDEYNESILFEIDSDLDHFLLSESEFDDANGIFGSWCFCPEVGYRTIDHGCIKGVKISETEWQIDINIEIVGEYGSVSKMISEVFTFKNN